MGLKRRKNLVAIDVTWEIIYFGEYVKVIDIFSALYVPSNNLSDFSYASPVMKSIKW